MSDYKPTNNVHDFKTLQQIINAANSDNVTMIAADFCAWLNMCVILRDKHNLKPKSSFVWKDDGENRITSIEVTEKKTGRVFRVDANLEKDE